MKYKDNKDESRLHVVYHNLEQEKECKNEAKSDKNNCKTVCSKKDKSCKKACNEAYKSDVKICIVDNNFQIKDTYEGYRTLSIYDILKLIGYE